MEGEFRVGEVRRRSGGLRCGEYEAREKKGEEEEEAEEEAVRDRDVVEEEKEKVVMGEVVRVFSANLLFHLCSPPALQPRPAKRHFTSHPHTHGARANTQKPTHSQGEDTHPQNCTRSLARSRSHAHTRTHSHTFAQLAYEYLATHSEK